MSRIYIMDEDDLPVTEATCEALAKVCEAYWEKRLQELREDWKWHRYDVFDMDVPCGFGNYEYTTPGWEVWPHKQDWTVEQWAESKPDYDLDREHTAIAKARRYIIARDFNEFDGQRADMLWKLQNGGSL